VRQRDVRCALRWKSARSVVVLCGPALAPKVSEARQERASDTTLKSPRSAPKTSAFLLLCRSPFATTWVPNPAAHLQPTRQIDRARAHSWPRSTDDRFSTMSVVGSYGADRTPSIKDGSSALEVAKTISALKWSTSLQCSLMYSPQVRWPAK